MLPEPPSGFCFGWTNSFSTSCWMWYNSDLYWQLHVCRVLGHWSSLLSSNAVLESIFVKFSYILVMAKCKLFINPKGRSWIVKRSYEDFRVLDKHLHLCIYDRRFSQLPELPRLDTLTDQSEVRSFKFATCFLRNFWFLFFIFKCFKVKQVCFLPHDIIGTI